MKFNIHFTLQCKYISFLNVSYMIIHVSKISSRRVGSCCVGFFICVNILEEKSDDEVFFDTIYIYISTHFLKV